MSRIQLPDTLTTIAKNDGMQQNKGTERGYRTTVIEKQKTIAVQSADVYVKVYSGRTKPDKVWSCLLLKHSRASCLVPGMI